MQSLSIRSQTTVEGQVIEQRKFSFCETPKKIPTEESLRSLVAQTESHLEEDEQEIDEESDENEDEYVKAIRGVVKRIIGRSAKQLNAVCSGMMMSL